MVQQKKVLNITHLGQYVAKAFVPRMMNTSVGCVYNVPLEYSDKELLETLRGYKVTKATRLTTYD